MTRSASAMRPWCKAGTAWLSTSHLLPVPLCPLARGPHSSSRSRYARCTPSWLHSSAATGYAATALKAEHCNSVSECWNLAQRGSHPVQAAHRHAAEAAVTTLSSACGAVVANCNISAQLTSLLSYEIRYNTSFDT